MRHKQLSGQTGWSLPQRIRNLGPSLSSHLTFFELDHLSAMYLVFLVLLHMRADASLHHFLDFLKHKCGLPVQLIVVIYAATALTTCPESLLLLHIQNGIE